MGMRGFIRLMGCLFVTLLLSVAAQAEAAAIYWTDWTSKTFGAPGSAQGSITFPGSNVVIVTYHGEIISVDDQGDWNFTAYTLPGTVDNAPTPYNVSIPLRGGNSIVNNITFSEPVVNPVMAIQSLGNPWFGASYTFTSSFTLLNSGSGHWGWGSLIQDGNSLTDNREGNGIIQFTGMYTSISWTVPYGENYHMFTVGAPSIVPEPATMLLVSSGLLGLAAFRRKFKK